MNILANIISLTIVFAVPLMLVALGGMYSEHSGVINLALEGIMVIGALCACFSLQSFDRSGFGPAHPQLSMLAAILIAGVSGMIFSLLLGLESFRWRMLAGGLLVTLSVILVSLAPQEETEKS
jgi:simple sugar transport system permease protein